MPSEVKAPVYDGDHVDEDWRAAVAKKAGARTRFEQVLVDKGPRRHPFAEVAVYSETVALPSGEERVRHFENHEAAQAFKGAHEAGDAKLKTKALKGTRVDLQEGAELRLAEAQARDSAPLGANAEPPVGYPAPEQNKLTRHVQVSDPAAAVQATPKGVKAGK